MKIFKKLNNLTLLFTFFVILAGSLVRMTGSGMGCPDWPKCFGYVIPPYKIEMLDWKPNHRYNEHQMILLNEKFYTVKSDFVSTDKFNITNWELFQEHDYTTFNPKHTYIEYFNRLAGALLGVFAFLALIFSFFLNHKKLILFSFITVFLIGFEAWLGALVVESVLSPIKITIHLLVAFIIIASVMHTNSLSKQKIFIVDKKIKHALLLTILAISIQVYTGTMVREGVDVFLKLGIKRNLLLDHIFNDTLKHVFSASFLTLSIFNLIIKLNNHKILHKGLIRSQYFLVGLLILALCSGIFLSFANLPYLFQPLHLLIATFIFSIAIYIFTTIKFKNI